MMGNGHMLCASGGIDEGMVWMCIFVLFLVLMGMFATMLRCSPWFSCSHGTIGGLLVNQE